jgi:hypothetical protein
MLWLLRRAAERTQGKCKSTEELAGIVHSDEIVGGSVQKQQHETEKSYKYRFFYNIPTLA